MHARGLWIAVLFAASAGVAIAACLGSPPPDNPNDAGSDGNSSSDSPVEGGDAGCSSDETTCGGACFNLKTSATNCGKCGRTCFGGSCSESTCSSFVVAKQPTTGVVAKVATDGTRIVWVDTGIVAILQVAPAGGTPITLAGSNTVNGGFDNELALANGVVAFAYAGTTGNVSVGVANVDTADSGVALINGTDEVAAVSLSTSAGHVFFVDKTGTLGTLYDTPISPGDAGTKITLVSSAKYGPDTAADDTHMFFEELQTGLFADTIGSSPAQFAPSTVTEAHLAVDGTWAYWSENDDAGTLHTVHRTLESSPGTQTQTPVDSIVGSSFATDGANVYYFNGTNIASRPVAGGPEVVLAPATATTQIVVGGGLLIWTDGATISGIVLP